MNCIDKLLLGVTKKVCPQGILRGFTGNIILRDWRGFNQDNPKEAYQTEVKLECDKYSVKPLSDAFVRDDNVSLFDHSLTANLKNISNEALQVLTGIQQIPVIVLVELTDLSYIELFPRNGGKLSFKNDFATQSKDKCQLSIKPFWKDQHEDYPPFNYATELSVISMSPINNSIDVAISAAFSLEFNTSIKSSEITHTIILREAFSKMVIENFIVSPTSEDITITGTVVTFHPTSNLSEGVEYEIIVPQGTFENIFGQQSRYIGSGEWSFTTAEAQILGDPILQWTQVVEDVFTVSPDFRSIVGGVAWDFGDGSELVISSTPSHTYSQPGEYVVKMYPYNTVTNQVDPASLDISKISYILFNQRAGINAKGHVDFSNFTGIIGDANLGTPEAIMISGQFHLTSLTYPVMQSAWIEFVNTGYIGELNLDGKLSGYCPQIHFQNNASLISIYIPTVSSRSINASYTSISELDLSRVSPSIQSDLSIFGNNCPNLTTVILPISESPIESFLLNDSNLNSIVLTGMPNFTSIDSGDYKFENNNMTQAIVDNILSQLDQISTSSFIDRSISIGGTNAAPSVAGLASVASLETKGFTVTHS